MLSSFDEPTDCCECLEVFSLTGHQWVSLEVRYHRGQQAGQVAHLVLEGLVAPIWSESTAPEVGANDRQYLSPVSILADRETGPHFPSHTQLPAWRERDCEATLAIDVSRYIRRDVHQSCRRVGCIDTV